MSGLFISYRRQDAAAQAGRLRDSLVSRFGAQDVFYDMADVPPGVDFAEYLHGAVDRCDVMLVVVGPRWISATDPSGQQRIQDPGDFIRTEVAAALRQDKRVVPVLVGGASLPALDEVPADLVPLLHRQAVELSDHRWDHDLARLIEALDGIIGRSWRDERVASRPGRAPSAAVPSPAARAPRASGGFFSRLSLAFDVLMGQRTVAPAPSQAPPPPTPSALPARAEVAPPPASPAPPVASSAEPAHQVFISHSTKDSALAHELVARLEQRGLMCWIAPRDIPPAVPSWTGPIVTAIADSRLAVVLLTAHAMPSIEVQREVAVAADEKIPLLGVLLDETPLSPDLKYYFVSAQRLDLARQASEEQLSRIVPTVARHLRVSLG